MNTTHHLNIVLLAALFLGLAVQVDAQRIRDREATVRVKTGTKAEKQSDESDDSKQLIIATPTPNPNFVVVAVVNQNNLTRAQLDRRVSAVMGQKKEDMLRIGSQDAGLELIQSLQDNPRAILDARITQEQQQFEIDDAIRRKEGELVKQWVEQTMLADEARRQGLVISNAELQDRLAEIEQQFRLSDSRVGTVLDAMGMTRAELESFIYDALLIEKLLDKYITLNATEDELRTVYESQRDFFVTPPVYRFAHFVITVDPDDSKSAREAFKRKAESVRKRLRNEDPTKVFEEENDISVGIYGDIFTWNIESNQLWDDIRDELKGMKVDDVSDVIIPYVMYDGEPIADSYQVLKLLEIMPRTGTTFESALPKIRRAMREVARQELLQLIRESKTHRVLYNLRGIPTNKLPDPAELNEYKPPVRLVRL